MTHRQEQLRLAKQKQRLREKQAGFGVYQIKLEEPGLGRLKAGMRMPEFVERLYQFLAHELLEVTEYPNLELLCWNRQGRYLTRIEAFRLYERNWRLIEQEKLPIRERALIEELAEEFGNGLINA